MASHSLAGLAPGLYRGTVSGVESGDCSARIAVRRVPGGCLTVDYEATSERHGLQHAEHTVVTPDALHVAFSEAPGVSVFELTADDVFVCLTPGPHALEIHATATADHLVWAWHWAPTGATVQEMSRAVCRLVDA